MKLCQKCHDEIGACGGDFTYQMNLVNYPPIVPESECEFWAHKILNEKPVNWWENRGYLIS